MGKNMDDVPAIIMLKVIGRDNGVLQFKMKKTKSLEKLMNVYCEKNGFVRSTTRFMYKGNVIYEAYTPSSLGMQNGDIIRVGGPGDVPAIIMLKVIGRDNGVLQFKMKKTKSLEKLMNVYCEKNGFFRATSRFQYKGKVIFEADTPLSLGMKSGDTIYVYY